MTDMALNKEDSDDEIKRLYKEHKIGAEQRNIDDFNQDDAMQTTKAGTEDYITNMKQFSNNYGVSIDIPGFYI